MKVKRIILMFIALISLVLIVAGWMIYKYPINIISCLGMMIVPVQWILILKWIKKK